MPSAAGFEEPRQKSELYFVVSWASCASAVSSLSLSPSLSGTGIPQRTFPPRGRLTPDFVRERRSRWQCQGGRERGRDRGGGREWREGGSPGSGKTASEPRDRSLDWARETGAQQSLSRARYRGRWPRAGCARAARRVGGPQTCQTGRGLGFAVVYRARFTAVWVPETTWKWPATAARAGRRPPAGLSLGA